MNVRVRIYVAQLLWLHRSQYDTSEHLGFFAILDILWPSEGGVVLECSAARLYDGS
jgi:hypothetical protein